MTTKPNTPTLDQLNRLPPGIARDIFAQANSSALGFEQRALAAAERGARLAAERTETAALTKAGLTSLARYRQLKEQGRHTEADIYRSLNTRTLLDEEKLATATNETNNGPEAA